MREERRSPNLLLSVIVPAYNEATTVDAALRRVRAVSLRLEIIAVNDANVVHTAASTGSSHCTLSARPTAAKASPLLPRTFRDQRRSPVRRTTQRPCWLSTPGTSP